MRFPSNTTDYLGAIEFQPLNGQDQPEGEKIELYLPTSVQFADKVELENVQLGAALGAAVDGNIGKTFDELSTNGAFMEAAKIGVTQAISMFSEKGGAAARLASRTAPNPNTRAIFKQVNLRQFQYTFKLIPNNESEAQTIGQIIKSFRTNMYPDTITESGSVGYKFPNRYRIEAFYDGNSMNDYNLKTEPSYLESLMTNFNPSSHAFMKSGDGRGYFAEIDLSLTFIEGRTLDRNSIGKGL